MSSETVRYYDFASRRVIDIPAAQLGPDMIQARVEGVEGVVWISTGQLKAGQVQHPPFAEDVRDVIRRIQGAFAEHYPLTLDQWEDGFRRDRDPAREIAYWLHSASVYSEFAAVEPAQERRAALFRLVMTCLNAGPDAIRSAPPPEGLERATIERVIARFYGRSA